MRRVLILFNILTHEVKLGVNRGTLTRSSGKADVGGEGIEAIDCDFDDEPVEIGYNATYITDILSKMPGEDVIFEFSTPVAAGLLYSPELPKDDFLCLVMPLRLAE